LEHEKLFTQNVTNITFIFETSPNTKPKEKKLLGGHDILYPPAENVRGHVPHVPQQIAPMVVTNAELEHKSKYSNDYFPDHEIIKN